jgi:hypothetical protein
MDSSSATAQRTVQTRAGLKLLALVLVTSAWACNRIDAQGDSNNTNGPGSMGAMPHDLSGPGVTSHMGAGPAGVYYGSQSWPPAAAGKVGHVGARTRSSAVR